MYKSFLIIFLLLSWASPVRAEDSFDLSAEKFPFPKETSVYTFDYANPKFNDCWDVNDIKQIYKTPENAKNQWNGTSYDDQTTESGARKKVCENLYFYSTPSSINLQGCQGLDSKDATKDPVCFFYKNKYEADVAEIAKKASGVDRTQLYPRIKACRWVSEKCVPINNVAMSHSVSVWINDNDNVGFCSDSKLLYNKRTCIPHGISNCQKAKIAELKILIKFLYFLDQKDEAFSLSLVDANIYPVKKMSQVTVDAVLEEFVRDYASTRTFNDAELGLYLGDPQKSPYDNTACDKAELLFKEDKLEKYKEQKKDKPEYTIGVEAVECSKFVPNEYLLGGLPTLNPYVIEAISNAKRETSNIGDSCFLYVVFLKKIDWNDDKGVINKIRQGFTAGEKHYPKILKDARQLGGLRITNFIYNDNYFAFMPVYLYDHDGKGNYNKYFIKDNIRLYEPGKRFGDICKMIETDFGVIRIEPLVAQAIIGLDSGILLSKGDLSFKDSKSSAPASLAQLAAIKLYCSEGSSRSRDAPVLYKPLAYDSLFLTDPAKPGYLGYIDDFIAAFNAAYPVDEKATPPNGATLDAFLKAIPENKKFTGSTFYKVMQQANSSEVKDDTLPAAYKEQLRNILTINGKRCTNIGSPWFFYALATNYGRIPLKINGVEYPSDTWIEHKLAEIKTDRAWVFNLHFHFFNEALAQGQGNYITKKQYEFISYYNPAYQQALFPALTNNVYGLYSDMIFNGPIGNTVAFLKGSAIKGPTDAIQEANKANNGDPNKNADGTTKKGRFGKALKGIATGAGVLGPVVLTAALTDYYKQQENQNIKDQLGFQRITSRMNECSAMDCTIKADFCKAERVKCTDKVKIWGIKLWEQKDQRCDKTDAEKAICDKLCAGEKLTDYPNPYTGEIEKGLTAYQICLRNVTNSLLQKSPCFDLIALNMRNPGMVNQQDIRECFVKSPQRPPSNPLQYGRPDRIPGGEPKTLAPPEEKGKAATAGSPGGAGGGAAPAKGYEAKEKTRDDENKSGQYKEGQGLAPRFVPGSTGYYGPSGYTPDAAAGSTAPTAKTMEESIIPSIQIMTGRHLNITRDKIH